MMSDLIPKIDKRSSYDISLQVQKLLREHYAPEWNEEFNPGTGEPKGLSTAIISIFSRLTEIVIERLNKVPEKNFLAFLDLLGASLSPPQPSGVPVTFRLTKGAVVDAIVPKGTRVAAPATESETEPVIFETDKELVVTSARLSSVYFKDPSRDSYSNHDALITRGTEGTSVFVADTQGEHILYMGSLSILSYTKIDRLSVIVELLTQELQNMTDLCWEFWNGSNWEEKIPVHKAGRGPDKPLSFIFDDIECIPVSSVNSLYSRWLRCRLKSPVTELIEVPAVKSLNLTAEIKYRGLKLDSGFVNSQTLDLSREFYPFGEKPGFGDVLYISSRDCFSQAGAEVTIHIDLLNPTSEDNESGITPVNKKGNPGLQWEYWDGQNWSQLDINDTTDSFTKSGEIKFIIRDQPEITDINGVSDFWVRARLVNGNYGKDAVYELEDVNNPKAGYVLIPSSIAPPVIKSVALDLEITREEAPDHVLTYNDFVYEDQTRIIDPEDNTFRPFRTFGSSEPALFIGFTLPESRSDFPNRKISLYVKCIDRIFQSGSLRSSVQKTPRHIWEYWNGESWSKLRVNDDTDLFSRSGLIEFLSPGNFLPKKAFGLNRYWLRIRIEDYDINYDPKICNILINTIKATQALTTTGEIIGTSNAGRNQLFRSSHSPVLPGQILHVREPELPPSGIVREPETGNIERDNLKLGVGDNKNGFWVRWKEVTDFYSSEAHDRHYVINHITGEIRFGDGRNGMIPPAGKGNIRLTEYRSGGGARGNIPKETVVELKTSVPYVDKVINIVAAEGGADAETSESLFVRAPREIRHRGRAVTVEDFEDLAVKAFPGVARAMCVPLRNLIKNPYAKRAFHSSEGEIGEVSIIVVPRSDDPKPEPRGELIKKVKEYLEYRSIPTVNISVVGPQFVSVNIITELALGSMEGAERVEGMVYRTIEEYLHPLTGGSDGKGWNFGRKPRKSDFYGLIESVPGVDHIISLKIDEKEDNPGIKGTGRFLVYSGKHDISVVMETAD